jgi:hypothetical protein
MTISALYLLIPAALCLAVGIWGWRNAANWAQAYPVDEDTQRRRKGVYQRGSVACLVVAAAFVALVVVSYV